VHGRRYYTWAELLRRVYAVDILTCPRCGGVRRLLAAIQDPDSIERVLRAMGVAVARAGVGGGSCSAGNLGVTGSGRVLARARAS
jgi:hypothetical protein